MPSLAHARLYGILDLDYVSPSEAGCVLRHMLSGGVDIVQLRGKHCDLEQLSALVRELHPVASAGGVPLIINDHAEIAARFPVDGVHIGQDDASVAEVHAQVGRPVIVGKSTHSLAQARAAAKEGADYIGFGPLFATPTKPDYAPIGTDDIRGVQARVQIPVFCIGGIKLENLAVVMRAGAERVVIVSGLLLASDVATATRRAKEILYSEVTDSRPASAAHRPITTPGVMH